MQREPPVPCANLHKSWLPATHAWTPKQLRKAFESKSVIRAPPPPPPSDPPVQAAPNRARRTAEADTELASGIPPTGARQGVCRAVTGDARL